MEGDTRMGRHCENSSRDRNDVSGSQGTPSTASSRQSEGASMEWIPSLRVSRRKQLCWCLEFGPFTSRNVRQYASFVLNRSDSGTCYGSHRKLIHLAKFPNIHVLGTGSKGATLPREVEKDSKRAKIPLHQKSCQWLLMHSHKYVNTFGFFYGLDMMYPPKALM
jgi:hypothetical protein